MAQGVLASLFHLNINFGFVVSAQIQIGSNEMIVDVQ